MRSRQKIPCYIAKHTNAGTDAGVANGDATGPSHEHGRETLTGHGEFLSCRKEVDSKGFPLTLSTLLLCPAHALETNSALLATRLLIHHLPALIKVMPSQETRRV